MTVRLITLFFIAVFCLPVLAEQPLTYDRISLSASSGEEVENDTLIAVLYAQQEGNSPSQLSKEVNLAISKAVEHVKRHPEIGVQTLDYSTTPVYNRQNLSGWRVRQSLRLESRDAPLLGELIGELQGWLGVSSISYGVSPQLRDKTEQRLIVEAVAAFEARADMLAETLGRKGYRLVEMQVNTAGIAPRPYQSRGASMALQAEAVPPPALEAGKQRIEVSVNATIELKP